MSKPAPASAAGDIVTFATDGLPPHVALITLNRPEARNAVNGAVADGDGGRHRPLEDDPEVWVGVLAPTPRARNVRCSAPAPTSRRSTPARPAR